MSDRGHYMRTYTGKKFYPLDPRAEEMNIVDIAHGLAYQCRFNGQTDGFFSVAEHSVHCSHIGPEDEAMERLMHDAAEAYIGDLVRPVKYAPELREIWNRIDHAVEVQVARKFGLVYPWPASVKVADEMTVNQELRVVMHGDEPDSEVTFGSFGHAASKIECWAPDVAYAHFMHRYIELESGRGRERFEIHAEISALHAQREGRAAA